jgi:hypothetical protein
MAPDKRPSPVWEDDIAMYVWYVLCIALVNPVLAYCCRSIPNPLVNQFSYQHQHLTNVCRGGR